MNLHELAPQYRQYYHILEAFKISEQKSDLPPPILATPTFLSSKAGIMAVSDQFQEDGEDGDEVSCALIWLKRKYCSFYIFADFKKKPEDKSKLSKRKLKKMTRLSVAELKQLVNRPDVVEMHDVTARDPKLLVQLKAHRNTVQVRLYDPI